MLALLLSHIKATLLKKLQAAKQWISSPAPKTISSFLPGSSLANNNQHKLVRQRQFYSDQVDNNGRTFGERVHGAMGSLLGKLGTMLSDEYKLLKDVRDDIKFLKDELEAMQAFLVMMADEEEPDQQSKLRANAVRELSYEIEDSIDKFMVHVEREPSSKSDGIMKLFYNTKDKIANIKTLHKIANDVKYIKSQVNEVNARYARYKIDESSRTRNEKVDPRLRAVYKYASELVGIDGPTDELVKWLRDKEGEVAHHPNLVSVVGYGGLGKTTLARQVYNKLGANFECRAFVSISRSPDMTKILGSILSEVSNGKEHARSTHQQIIDQIRDILKDKRYFVIIDDVWDIEMWKTLDCALVKNDCGSVIMTTTRIHDVAKSCCSSHGDLIYKIQPLSVTDSKKLFFKRIFGCEEKCPPYLKEASEDILKRCGGLPLAINAISSLLATGKTKEEWDRVRLSISFEQGKNCDIDAMNYILSLSYIDLPLYLRSCLLYLTMFPEDYKIKRRRLIHRWISEGFVHGEDGEDLFEIGEMYFHELINRSLIQPVKIGFDGKGAACVVHDTILDFLICKSIDENFCTLLSNYMKPDRRIRRLCLLGNEDQGRVEQLDLSHARSLGAFRKTEQLPSLVKSNALRVLDLENCDGLEDHHIKDIGRLFQLRYLNVRWTCITELPKQIGDLVYLETLDVSNSSLVELPESVTCLKRLVRLFVDECSKLPDCIGNMEKLQDLGNHINIFSQSVKFVEELGKLINLRKLSVRLDYRDSDKACYEKKEMLVSSLRKLDTRKLHTLSIVFSFGGKHAETLIEKHLFFIPALKSIREIDLCRGQLCWITKWMLSLANLEKLNLSGQRIRQQDVDMVGGIPNLLEFTWPSFPEPVTISSSSSNVGFQQLQVFEFKLCVREFMFEAGAMPNVRKLSLDIELKEIKSASGGGGGFDDIGIQHLSSLAELHVYIDCEGARAADVEAVEVAFKGMAEAHPNRPKLEMRRFPGLGMLKDDE